MKIKNYLKEFFIVAAAAFIVVSLVSFIYNYVFHSDGKTEWATAFRLAVIMGLIIPRIQRCKQKSSKINLANPPD
jgi:hypothetical protein